MCKKRVTTLRKITKKLFAFILHDNRCDVQKNKKCIKTIQKKNEFCISRQLCEKNKSGKTNISSDKEKH